LADGRLSILGDKEPDNRSFLLDRLTISRTKNAKRFQRHCAPISLGLPRKRSFFWLRDEARRFELRLQSFLPEGEHLCAVVHPHGEHASWF
jgi:hypothetical protein